jgi:hypothetical protein
MSRDCLVSHPVEPWRLPDAAISAPPASSTPYFISAFLMDISASASRVCRCQRLRIIRFDRFMISALKGIRFPSDGLLLWPRSTVEDSSEHVLKGPS